MNLRIGLKKKDRADLKQSGDQSIPQGTTEVFSVVRSEGAGP